MRLILKPADHDDPNAKELVYLALNIENAEKLTDKGEQLRRFKELHGYCKQVYEDEEDSAEDLLMQSISSSYEGQSLKRLVNNTSKVVLVSAVIGLGAVFGGLGGGLIAASAFGLLGVASAATLRYAPAAIDKKYEVENIRDPAIKDLAFNFMRYCEDKLHDIKRNVAPLDLAQSSHFDQIMDEFPKIKERFLLAAARENVLKNATAASQISVQNPPAGQTPK